MSLYGENGSLTVTPSVTTNIGAGNVIVGSGDMMVVDEHGSGLHASIVIVNSFESVTWLEAPVSANVP